MRPRAERVIRAVVIFALGMLGGFLLSRATTGKAKGAGEPCAQCAAAGGCPRARPAGRSHAEPDAPTRTPSAGEPVEKNR
jgi:hypothetical protein